jgi:hypothetical protein
MQYHHVVNAIQLKNNVYDENGEIIAKSGDWIITDFYEQQYMTNDAFVKKYSIYYPNSNYGWSGTWSVPVNKYSYGFSTTDGTVELNNNMAV